MRHYLNAIRYEPKLLGCTTESLAAACLVSAQYRLEPGPLGHCYFVPFGTECVWVISYTGVIELGRRGGATGLRSSVIWNCDEFVSPWENEKGLHYSLKPGPLDQREERLGVLVTWKEAGGREGPFFPPRG